MLRTCPANVPLASPRLSPAPWCNVQNKAHTHVLVLIIYCTGISLCLEYVSACKPRKSLQMRTRRQPVAKCLEIRRAQSGVANAND